MAHAPALPKISIVTPSYNQAAFIERTIQSVLSQGYPNLEYTVVDGGSTDGTVQIIQKYQGRIRWVSEPDKGQSDAINKGLRMSTGEIIGYLNSDDILLPGSLHAVAAHMLQHPADAWVTGYAQIIDQNDQKRSSFIRQYKNFLLRHFSPSSFLVINYIAQMSTFWRRTAMEKIEDFSTEHHLVMDYDYWLRLLALGRPGIILQDLSGFRIHPDAKGSLRYAQQFQESYQVASRYIHTPWLRALSWLHNKTVIVLYSTLSRVAHK